MSVIITVVAIRVYRVVWTIIGIVIGITAVCAVIRVIFRDMIVAVANCARIRLIGAIRRIMSAGCTIITRVLICEVRIKTAYSARFMSFGKMLCASAMLARRMLFRKVIHSSAYSARRMLFCIMLLHTAIFTFGMFF